MRAAQITSYNKNNIHLKISEVPLPRLGDKDVLIRIKAAGVNPLDNMISRGQVRIIVPYQLPTIGGNEVVGIVEKIGSAVRRFERGDRVFARLPFDRIGAFAEYASVGEDALAKVPDYLSDVEAAAVPLTSLTIIQALELMEAKSGATIFISGGTGGVGAMAIPIAKARGLKVITSGSTQNRERVISMGADRFIDYKTDDYTKSLSDIDYVLDTLGGEETEKQMSILKPGGSLVSLKGMPNASFAKRMNLSRWKQVLFGLVGRKFDKRAEKFGISYDFIFVRADGKQLQEVADLFSKLNIKPSIDAVYDFGNINDALEKVDRGHSKGKTVLIFEDHLK